MPKIPFKGKSGGAKQVRFHRSDLNRVLARFPFSLQRTEIKPLYQSKAPWPRSRADHLVANGDASHQWDWLDTAWWDSWGLPTPFAAGHYTGVDLTLQSCNSMDGWELYIRRVLTIDDLPQPSAVAPVLKRDQKYFALYNVLTGVLRIFAYFEGAASPTDQLLTKSYVTEGGPDSYLATNALFHHLGPVGTTDGDVNTVDRNDVFQTMLPITNGWIVVDLALSFDYFSLAPPIFLDTFILAMNLQDVSLSGNFELKVSLGRATNEPLLTRAQSLIAGADRSATATSASLDGAGKRLEAWGTTLQAAGVAGGSLVAAGAALLAVEPYGAAVAAGYTLISSLLSFGSNRGGANVSTSRGTVTLDGQIKDDWTESRVILCAKEASDGSTGYADIPYLFKKFPGLRLGIFSLTRTPNVIIDVFHGPVELGTGGCLFRAAVTVAEDVRDLLRMNPDASSYFGVHVEASGVQVLARRQWVYNKSSAFSFDDVPGNITKTRDPLDERFVIYSRGSLSAPDKCEPVLLISKSDGKAYEPVFNDVFVQVGYTLRMAAEKTGLRYNLDLLEKIASAVVTYRCSQVVYNYHWAEDGMGLG